jgi:hypothetical protein
MRSRFALSRLACIILLFVCFSPFSSMAGVIVRGSYVLDRSQYPGTLKRHNPADIFVIYSGRLIESKWRSAFMKGDTITNLKGFIDSTRASVEYRLSFESKGEVDSVWQTNKDFQITDKAYRAGPGSLRIIAYDNGQVVDQFVYNYQQKYRDERKPVPTLKSLLRQVVIYTRTDRDKYAASAVWVLSIGIDDYGSGIQFGGCKADAERYSRFFRDQYLKLGYAANSYHDYTLTGKAATREAILSAMKDIAGKAAPNDYFIFNFAGYSQVITSDSVRFQTHFFPFDSSVNVKEQMALPKSARSITDRLISLKVLQEHIQLIQAKKQLFISEAGSSLNFKAEFIKTMLQNSPAISAMLNVNRVIMVPNGLGWEIQDDENKASGLLAYGIAALDSSHNIYDIFGDDRVSMGVVSDIKGRVYRKKPRSEEYFDVFFEKKFLQQYQDIFGDDMNKTRGGGTLNKQIQKSSLTGNRHALVIGTDNYKGKGWDKLNNPIYDATEIADILRDYYNYEVQLLKDPSMDNIYSAIRDYYRSLKPEDKLIIYIAGHGDYDRDLLDDGFIVCSDSRSVEEDPLRNSYIQHTKLKKMINKIPAKQILVLLDICHGGVFDEEVRNDPTSRITNRNVLELLRINSSYTVRKVLSSVGLEAAFDGKAGKHSPFAAYLISILNAKGGVEGIVTLSDILALLQKASLNETATLKISPHLADFGSNDPLGEFILIPFEAGEKKEEVKPAQR